MLEGDVTCFQNCEDTCSSQQSVLRRRGRFGHTNTISFGSDTDVSSYRARASIRHQNEPPSKSCVQTSGTKELQHFSHQAKVVCETSVPSCTRTVHPEAH